MCALSDTHLIRTGITKVHRRNMQHSCLIILHSVISILLANAMALHASAYAHYDGARALAVHTFLCQSRLGMTSQTVNCAGFYML